MTADRAPLPTGTVTFLFSDIEGSTRLAQALGTDGYRELLERHQAILRSAFAAHGGIERGTEGDSFFVVFADAAAAVAAAVEAQRALAEATWPVDGHVRVRMGLHTGSGTAGGDDYVGIDVNRAARIASAAHGGQVLVSDATRAVTEASTPPGVDVRDLGPHRLKDLDRPERLHQLVVPGLPAEFPPPRATPERHGNLPPRLTTFVGREAERERLVRLVGDHRLVTITGPGGTGKTSLALLVAADVADRYRDGAWFVGLDSVADPELVPAAIARAFRLEVEDHRSRIERVADFVAERELLIVLDNFEHLLPASGVVRTLLERAPAVRFLVASQAPLRVIGEQEFALAPLPVPSPDANGATEAVRHNAAVQLFVERARAVRPDFSLDASNAADVARICARLDGLPLAIELAAAQVRLLSPSAILERVSKRVGAVGAGRGDVPARQRNLEALMTWSYDLLEDDQRTLLRRLSAFAGGAELGAIDAIAVDVAEIPDAVDALSGLVERSLVRLDPATPDRYGLLETIRAFGAARLAGAGEDGAVERRHAEIFAELVEEAEPNLYRAYRRVWLERLAREHDNIRAALDRMEAAGEIEIALRIAAAAWRFWQQAGHLVEAIPRIERLLEEAATVSPPIDPVLMSRAEEAAGGMGYWQRIRDVEDIKGHYLRSLELATEAGDAARIAWATYNLSFAYDYVPSSDPVTRPDRERATALREDALARFRALGDDRGVAYTLWSMGGSPTAITKPLPELRDYLREALDAFRRIDDAFGETWALLSTAMIESELGNIEDAREAILDAAALFLRDGDLSGQMVILDSLAALAARTGDSRLAVRIDASGRAARRATGTLTPPIAPLRTPIEAARASLDADAVREEDAAGASVPMQIMLSAALENRQGTIRRAADLAHELRVALGQGGAEPSADQ